MSLAPIFIERPVLSSAPIIAMACGLGITLQKPHDLHVTVIFTRKEVAWCRPVFQPDPSALWLYPQKFAFQRFGPDGSLLVLTFESQELQSRHRQLLAGGAEWEHENYQPHITLGPTPSHELPRFVSFSERFTLGPEVRKVPKLQSSPDCAP